MPFGFFTLNFEGWILRIKTISVLKQENHS